MKINTEYQNQVLSAHFLFFYCYTVGGSYSDFNSCSPTEFHTSVLYTFHKMCVPMPTHCTIVCFEFHARRIDGVKCGLFSNHAPLGQTTLLVG